MEICRKRRGAGDVETGWEKKNYDDPSSDSFSVLTTLKNRWTLFLNRRDSDYNPHVWFFFRLSFHFHLLSSRFVTTVVCRPNHRRKNVTPRTVLLWSIHMYMYIYITKRSRSKILFVFFFLFFVSHVVVYRENGMKIGKRQKENILKKEKRHIYRNM